MSGPNHKLDKYKKYVSGKLESLTPIFQKIATGDFSVEVELPQKEDEFTPLIVSLSIILDDLKKLDKENKEKQEILKKRVDELERFRKLTMDRELKMIELKKELEELKKQKADNKF